MDDVGLMAMIRAYRTDSLGPEDSELSNQRAKSLDHYYGRPYGDELEGRSQVVSNDLSETVDWLLPVVMKPFISTARVVEFDPLGPDDEEGAKQETDYTNYVIEQNNRWMIFHDWFKDALILKNGYVKHWWDRYEEEQEEDYESLTEDELTQLMAALEQDGAEVKILGKDERQIPMPVQPPVPGVPNLAPQVAQTLTVYDVKLSVVRRKGRVCIEVVAPENMRVSKRCKGSLQDSPFTEYHDLKTRTDLIEMGMPEDWVNQLPAYEESPQRNSEEIARSSLTNELEQVGTDLDKSMDRIAYTETAVKVDYDGDGRAELRMIVTAGDKIPPGEQWNQRISSVPFTSISPKRMPHRHIGESLDDDISDLQQIKTILLRQLLDNIYVTNNQQTIVNDNAVIDDFMRSIPGGVKRVKGTSSPAESVYPMPVEPILSQILPAIDKIDAVMQNRTGVNEASTGLDPDVLKQATAGAIAENLNRAGQKVEMIARLFGEGVKELVLQVHKLILMHEDEARTVRLRGKWVNVNPQEWKDRTDLSVNVGLGTGTEQSKTQKLMLISSLQEKLMAMGLVGAKQAHQTFTDICEVLGFQNPDKWVISPDSPDFKPPQPQPPPQVQVAQIKAQSDQQGMMLEHDLKTKQAVAEQSAEGQRHQAEMELEARKIMLQHGMNNQEQMLGFIIELAKAALAAKADPSQIPADVAAARQAI